jgi:hypothetical protein
MLRKSAAAGTESLRRALEILEPRGLREDTDAAVRAAAERLADAYARETSRLSSDPPRRRHPPAPLRVGDAEREALAGRLLEPVGRLAPLFARLEASQETLRARLEAYEAGPPSAGDAALGEAAGEWRAAVRRLDRAYAAAWRAMLGEIVRTWNAMLLPRLVRARLERGGDIPEWARIAAALAGLVLLVTILVLFF